MNRGFFLFIKAIARAIFAILFPARVQGAERIPAEGAVILCGNHISMLDPIIAGLSVRRPVRFMAKEELFRFKPLGALITALGAYPVKRGATDMAAIRTSMKLLKEGEVLGIFPQGSREKDGEHLRMENGVGLMAQRSGAAVCPMRIVGPYRPFRRTPLFIGAPIDLQDLEGRSDSLSIDTATRRIEEAIWALGPDHLLS